MPFDEDQYNRPQQDSQRPPWGQTDENSSAEYQPFGGTEEHKDTEKAQDEENDHLPFEYVREPRFPRSRGGYTPSRSPTSACPDASSR